MVFFTCDACGESLKKGAVEKHYQFKCRNCSVLSCLDCGKDFYGDTYKEHTKCISEEEKYSGKDYKPKPGANKGEAKQEQWTYQVQMAINKCKADPKLRNVLERLKDYPNIPRKRVKFENFVKNSLGIRDGGLAARTWDLISAEIVQPNTPDNNSSSHAQINTTEETNGKQENTESSSNDETKKVSKRERKEERQKQNNKSEKKDKKRKLEDDEVEEDTEPKKKRKKKNKDLDKDDDDDNQSKTLKKKKSKNNKEEAVTQVENQEDLEENKSHAEQGEKFSWEAAIVGCLKKADGHELSIKKLKKKVFAEYAARGGDPRMKSENDLLAKFNKKISKNPRLLSQKDRVKLVS